MHEGQIHEQLQADQSTGVVFVIKNSTLVLSLALLLQCFVDA